MIKPTVSNATLKATLKSASLTTLAERLKLDPGLKSALDAEAYKVVA